MKNTENLRINAIKALISPALLHQNYPLRPEIAKLITDTRQEAAAIIQGKDPRLLVIVGPCSIHDEKSALEYAHRLKKYADQHRQTLCILMRVYFEKPRTTVGWKGYINDPHMDESYDINHGLAQARQLLLKIGEIGVPTAAEFLDTIIPQYIADLISWGAIGARTVESQIHRELASGLSMPIGFKNGTGGSVDIAVDAVQAARHPHHFLGITESGIGAIVSTQGNPDCHIILRGGKMSGPNFDADAIAKAVALLEKQKLPTGLMVDCSHGNSQKDHNKQVSVVENLCEQIRGGNKNIIGVMIESHLQSGRQDHKPSIPLVYGQSITDACIGWEDTLAVLDKLAKTVGAK